MAIAFQVECFADVASEQQRLTNAHWAETEEEMYGPVSNALDVQGFIQLEQAGVLHIQTLRCDGDLMGYAVYILTPQPQLGGKLTAGMLGLFVDREIRKSQPFAAMALLHAAEESLLERGVDGVTYSSPHSRPCDALYRRLGAKPVETNYYKSLRG